MFFILECGSYDWEFFKGIYVKQFFSRDVDVVFLINKSYWTNVF